MEHATKVKKTEIGERKCIFHFKTINYNKSATKTINNNNKIAANTLVFAISFMYLQNKVCYKTIASIGRKENFQLSLFIYVFSPNFRYKMFLEEVIR